VWSIAPAVPPAENNEVFEAPADPRASSRRPLTVGGLLVIALVGLTFWSLLHRLSLTGGDDVRSALDLAGRIGCESTYREAARPGSSRSAGSCTIHGADVELRVYGTLGEAMAWLDGAQGQSDDPGTAGWGGVDGTWAVRITGTRDAVTVDDILSALKGQPS
jgi:hypothetical protein